MKIISFTFFCILSWNKDTEFLLTLLSRFFWSNYLFANSWSRMSRYSFLLLLLKLKVARSVQTPIEEIQYSTGISTFLDTTNFRLLDFFLTASRRTLMVEVEIEVLALEPVAAVDELEGAGIGVNLTAVVGVVLAALVLGLLCCIFQPGEMSAKVRRSWGQ